MKRDLFIKLGKPWLLAMIFLLWALLIPRPSEEFMYIVLSAFRFQPIKSNNGGYSV